MAISRQSTLAATTVFRYSFIIAGHQNVAKYLHIDEAYTWGLEVVTI